MAIQALSLPRYDYSHRHSYLTEAEITPRFLPDFGVPHHRIAQAFTDSYGAIVSLLRSPTFHQNLDHLYSTSPSRVFPYVLAQLDSAASHFHPILANELSRSVALGAAQARTHLLLPFTKAAPSAQPLTPLTPLTPLAPGLPPQLFPDLKIPRYPSSLRIPRSRRLGRLQAPQEHIDAAKGLSLDLIQQINDTQRLMIGDYITQAITRGIDGETTGMRIANVTGLFPRWAQAATNLHQRMLANGVDPKIAQARANTYADELRAKRGQVISRTEIMRALNAGRAAQYNHMANEGIIDRERSTREWLSASYGACDVCAELGDPTHADTGIGPEMLNYEEMKERGPSRRGGGAIVVGLDTPFQTPLGPVMGPPLHPNCFPAGTFVSGPKPVGVIERWYEGDLVEVLTASGLSVTATPNHPMLTMKGWVPIGSLGDGDCLFDGSLLEGPESDFQKVPTLIEEVVDTFRGLSRSSTSTSVASEDFHGDGAGSRTCVVTESPETSNTGTPETSKVLFDYKAVLDPVVKIQWYSFSGRVFNLETESGWYISNGLIAHNCRCTTLTRPVYLKEPPSSPGQQLQDAATLSDPELVPLRTFSG